MGNTGTREGLGLSQAQAPYLRLSVNKKTETLLNCSIAVLLSFLDYILNFSYFFQCK